MTSPNDHTTALYVDTQNLGQNDQERSAVLMQTIRAWPRDLMSPSLVFLYVDGDTNIWNSIWQNVTDGYLQSIGGFGRTELPKPEIKPAHRYSNNPDKNAADITLVLDALDDIHTGKVDFVVVLSNDSDFAGLLYKLEEVQTRDEAGRFTNHRHGNAPFLLITHANSGRTRQLESLPNANRLALPAIQPESEEATGLNYDRPNMPSHRVQTPTTPAPLLLNLHTKEEIAGQVERGVGERHRSRNETEMFEFTYRDAYNSIRGNWDQVAEIRYGHAEFSKWFHEEIWPVMEQRGAQVANPYALTAQDFLYQMSEAVRDSVRGLQSHSHQTVFDPC